VVIYGDDKMNGILKCGCNGFPSAGVVCGFTCHGGRGCAAPDDFECHFKEGSVIDVGEFPPDFFDNLKEFANWVLDECSQANAVEWWDIQEKAHKLGLLHIIKVVEPCGEYCECMEFENIPGECYRKVPFLVTRG